MLKVQKVQRELLKTQKRTKVFPVKAHVFASEVIGVIYRLLCLSSYCTAQLVPEEEKGRVWRGWGVYASKGVFQ